MLYQQYYIILNYNFSFLTWKKKTETFKYFFTVQNFFMFFLINLKNLYLFVAFFTFVLIYIYAKNPHHSSASCFWPDPEVAQTQLHPYWKQSITKLLLKLSVSNFFIHPCNLWEIKIMHPQKSSTEDRVKFPAKCDGPATLVSLFRDLYMYCNAWLSDFQN